MSHKFESDSLPAFIRDVMKPVASLQGDNIPVSALPVGGKVPHGQTQFEKRMIANEVCVCRRERERKRMRERDCEN